MRFVTVMFILSVLFSPSLLPMQNTHDDASTASATDEELEKRAQQIFQMLEDDDKDDHHTHQNTSAPTNATTLQLYGQEATAWPTWLRPLDQTHYNFWITLVSIIRIEHRCDPEQIIDSIPKNILHDVVLSIAQCGYTLIHFAILHNNLDFLLTLFKHLEEHKILTPEAKYELINYSLTITTLPFVIYRSEEGIRIRLIQCYTQNNIISPLMMAAMYGYYKLVKWLLDNGADPTVTDADGNNALHYTLLYPYEFGLCNEILRQKSGIWQLLNNETLQVTNNIRKTPAELAEELVLLQALSDCTCCAQPDILCKHCTKPQELVE